MAEKDIKYKSFDEIKDKYLGKEGTPERDQYEFDLKLDVLGDMIRHLRNKKNLTQSQLAEMIGVKRSEISKLERGSRNMTLDNREDSIKKSRGDLSFQIQKQPYQGVADGMVGFGRDPRA